MAVKSTATMYDPPSGWRYGFPKQYLPLEGETIEQTLLRDGYPQKELDWGAAKYVRFWDVELGEGWTPCE